MPKRKKLPKLPDYTGIPKDNDKLVVQKSNPLQTLSETKLSLAQFKILDAYLSRIDSHDEEKRYVRFEKGELEKILDVTKISREDLQARLENLFQTVTIKDANKRKGFTIIALFEKAEAYQDDDGLWQVDLACTSSALEYVFNIENLGYLRYRLKNIIDLTSRYSYILYLYLENNRFRKSWKINLTELKKILNCNAARYNQFKYFNSEILKKAQQELHEKTDLRFSYQPTDKRGRSYTAIIFTLETVADRVKALEDQSKDGAKQLSFSDTYSDYNEVPERAEPIDYGSDLADLLGETCFNEFSPEQIRVIQDLVLKYVGHDHIECSDYLTHKLHITNALCKRKDTESRYKYLLVMINNDIKNPGNVL